MIVAQARVMNVRRRECDEQPFRPILRNALLNQITMLIGIICALLAYPNTAWPPHP